MKLMKFFLPVFGLLMITGCGSKSLSCVSSDSNDDFSVNKTITINYDSKGENVLSLSFVDDMVMGDVFSKDDIEGYIETYNFECNAYNMDGVKCDVSNDSKNIKKLLEIDMKKVSKEEMFNKLGINEESYKNINSTKESLEGEGYVCN